jgi:hypothetical protein
VYVKIWINNYYHCIIEYICLYNDLLSIYENVSKYLLGVKQRECLKFIFTSSGKPDGSYFSYRLLGEGGTRIFFFLQNRIWGGNIFWGIKCWGRGQRHFDLKIMVFPRVSVNFGYSLCFKIMCVQTKSAEE